MCFSTFFFPCSTYKCKSKGSSIQCYNFTCSIVGDKLGLSAEGMKAEVIHESGAKRKYGRKREPVMMVLTPVGANTLLRLVPHKVV